MPQSKKRKKEYMRQYMAQRRAKGLSEGLTNSYVSPSKSTYPRKLSSQEVRQIRNMGLDPEKLPLQGTNKGTNKSDDFRAIIAKLDHLLWLVRDLVKSLKSDDEKVQRIAELENAVTQITQHLTAGARIASEHIPEYDSPEWCDIQDSAYGYQKEHYENIHSSEG